MAAVTEAAENPLLISHSAVWTEWTRALNIFVGRAKRHKVEEVRKGTGISPTMIYGWLSGHSHDDWRNPGVGHLLSMMAYLGPEFTTEITRLASQGAFWLPDADDMTPGDLAADLAEDTADVVRRAADGEFCRDDRKALGPRGRRLMVVGAQLAHAAA